MKRDWRRFRAGDEYFPPGTHVWQLDVVDGHLTVAVSAPRNNVGWHMSISHRRSVVSPFTGKPVPGRIPTWEEIRDARYDLVPDDVTVAMLLPPSSEYVDIHPTTMHLHQVSGDTGGLAQWVAAQP